MGREIVLDTETTGLDAAGGDRLIEIGCVELLNRIPTGRDFHVFINPQGRKVHPEAVAVHGITDDFLRDKPTFGELAAPLLDFIGDAPLVIHNAEFDMGFLNSELERLGHRVLRMDIVVDTLALARRKHPAGPNSLDAMCKRYGIDNTKRSKHGALLDATLLAHVYVELLGERQAALALSHGAGEIRRTGVIATQQRPSPLPARLSAEQAAAHRAFIATLGSEALWLRYLPAEPG